MFKPILLLSLLFTGAISTPNSLGAVSGNDTERHLNDIDQQTGGVDVSKLSRQQQEIITAEAHNKGHGNVYGQGDGLNQEQIRDAIKKVEDNALYFLNRDGNFGLLEMKQTAAKDRVSQAKDRVINAEARAKNAALRVIELQDRGQNTQQARQRLAQAKQKLQKANSQVTQANKRKLPKRISASYPSE